MRCVIDTIRCTRSALFLLRLFAPHRIGGADRFKLQSQIIAFSEIRPTSWVREAPIYAKERATGFLRARAAHMTTRTGISITLDGVDYEIEGKQVIHDLSFSVKATMLGIVGRNGSGKSTLAMLLAGLTEPTSGSIEIDGTNMAKDRRAALRDVGVLFQNPDHQLIFPTVDEELSFGLRQQGLSKSDAADKAHATLKIFDKAHWDGASIHTMSQGQKHLVCLMSIVAMEPRLLLLDEPFAGLDIPTKAQLTRYLSLYHGNLVHISHDPRDFDGYAQMIWLEEGCLRLDGTAEDVLPAYLDTMTSLGASDDISDLTG